MTIKQYFWQKNLIKKMNIKPLLILLFFILSQGNAFAEDDIRLTATGRQVVKVGERFRIVYELNADGRNFSQPNFGSFQVLSGPNTSSSSSIQIINGSYQQSYSQTYTFVVQANKIGKFKIPPASVKVKGKTYTSNSITIEVVKGGNTQNGSSGNNSTKSSNNGVLQKDDVYIKATISKKNPYLGEQIIITYRIYTKVPVSNLTMKKGAAFRSFWSKDLADKNTQYKQSTKVINGEEYITAVIGKYALFPQKTGKIVIEPAQMECVVQLRTQSKRRRSNDPFEDFFNDPFFNRNIKNIETTLKSNTITLDVKPLPQKGKPEGFTGAVGNFTFTNNLDNNQLKANDALTLTIGVSGRGNIELITAPEIHFPVDFETYDPKTTSKINTSSQGISGRKKFEYLAIPRNAGDFVIEPVVFSYFNPKDKQYHSFSTERYSIHVEKGDNSNGGGITYSSSTQEDIRFIGEDIHHIKTIPSELKPAGKFLFASTTYYLLISLPALLLLLFIVFWKKRQKQKGNVGMMKNRKANKVAKARLQKAAKFKDSGNDKAFYEEIAQALWGYIADKFSIKQSVLSVETVKETLQGKGVATEVIDNFVNTLNNIEFARFAPGDSSGKMKTIFDEAMHAITQAEKALSKGKTGKKIALFTFAILMFFTVLQGFSQDNQTLMNTANSAYNEGLYDSALNVYHRIENENLESAELFYNIGNSYFKNNELALAILYYEKAKKLAPNDEDIEYNLGIANSLIVDKIEKIPVLFYKNWWNYFYNLFNADVWTIISIASWLILLLFVGIFVLTPSRSIKKLSFYFGLFFLFLSIGTFGLASQKYYFTKEHKDAIIFTPTITVKSSPTLNAVDLFVVHEGTKIKILDHVQNWVKIKIPDGSIGWLPEESLKEI
jgi:tetratricopeptide (TPR) repeat protein